MRKLLSLLTAILLVGSVWCAEGDEITSVANIVSGKTYYIKGVRTSNTYYLTFTDEVGSQGGTECTKKSDAVAITFTAVTGGWTLTTPSGNYIAPGTSNGKINVSADAIVVTGEDQNSKIRLSIVSGTNTWSIQKNNSAANFGGYKNTQTDITLIEAAGASGPVLQSIAISGTATMKTYEEGDVFDVTGLVVTGTYDKGDPATISDGISWKARTNAGSDDAVALANYHLTEGQTSLEVQATVSAIASAWFEVSGLTVNEHIVKPGTYDIVPGNALWGTSYTGNVTNPPTSISGSQKDVSVTFNRNTATRMYVTDSQTRTYDGYTIVLTVPVGYEMTQVVFTGSTWVAPTVNLDVMTSEKTWKGFANSLTFTFSGISYVENISVTYAAVDPNVGRISATPNSVLAHSEGDDGSIAIAYTNISNMSLVEDIVVYDDAEHTTPFSGEWLLAEWNQDKTAIEYVAGINTGSTDRAAYLYVSAKDNQGDDVEKVILILQSKCDFAALPFSFTGGRSNIESTVGLTHSGIGTDYTGTGDPKLKFDDQNDNLILKINEAAGTLSFNIKGNGFSGGTFKVQASEDGDSYTDLASYTSLGDTETKSISSIAANVRYIKWIYTKKSSGNVGLGNISLTKSGTTSLDNIESSTKAVKVLRNGVLYIEKAGHIYNVMGQLVK